jgi:ABC-type nitrate/sulfonate/bicarbonate transport system substrate-binding protein
MPPALTGKFRRKNQVIRIGFIALTDCAPLVMARELGLFEKHRLKVELSREIGWATIREKVTYGELDAAHAPAGMLFAAAAGLGGIKADCLTGLVLNLHGNAITLSQRLWQAGVRDGRTLREHVRKSGRPVTLGTVYQWSSHSVLLRLWLKRHGLDVENEAEVVVVPPSQMVAHLRAGHLDGFCAGEPWNSLAVMSRAGWVVARSAELAPLHPEKVLMVRESFAERSDEQHIALIAALLEAAHFCDEPANREYVADMLARPAYVGADAEAIRRSMRSVFDYGNGRIEPCPGFNIFGRGNASEPDLKKAAWVAQTLVSSTLVTAAQIPRGLGAKCFRADIFERARALVKPDAFNSAA